MIWALLILGIYPYVIYPVLIGIIAAIRPKLTQKGDKEFSVTVIIAAYNEEQFIEDTVRNKLEQKYPPDLLRILVVSDGSTDATESIVSSIASETDRVSLMSQVRSGKTAGLNLAVASVESDIVVFSDANSIYEIDAIQQLVSQFTDPTVGYVSGIMMQHDATSNTSGASIEGYLKYEYMLRKNETKIGSIVGVDGGIDAVRRSLYVPMRADQLPDFVLPLAVVDQRFRVVFEPAARSHEEKTSTTEQEFQMRVRVATRAMWALIDFLHLLNPFRTGIFSAQLLSHKWLRYLSFLPLGAAAMLIPIQAAKQDMVTPFLVAELLFVSLLLLSFVPILREKLRIVSYAQYFVLINLACLVAVLNLIRGERFQTWNPRGGK